jgi:phage-related protein
MTTEHPAKAHWRFYRTAGGRGPVEEFLGSIPLPDRAAISAVMLEVRCEGLKVARHVDGDLYELRASGLRAHYRLLFAQEAKFILLAVDVFDKDTQRTPPQIRKRALDRLRDWRERGRQG